jgi:hypothetical protein
METGMGDVVDLHGQLAHLEDDHHELVVDLCRYSEGLLSEKDVKKRHHFDNATWKRLGKDDALVEKVEAEKLRRMRDGSTKRELAQKHVVKAPEILNGIMSGGNDVSPKHKIDAIRTLDGMAANGPEGAPMTDRFIITINLTADGSNSDADVLRFNKSIKVDVDDVDPFNDTAPQKVIAATTVKKNEDDDGPGYF